ncbi:signal transduction histidine kinase [Kitasatospora sp. MAP12-15]|uniref:sensor histidine kinase n=1 Tax=unclassified Kitasatospora TaxID=2633591 RepID=UPI0024743790|nr:HAMP domain-containing sensor histidine kinase [Kitasatospora sp. MAP12-44]MDH6114364.1 signal transduction histidine kinase [Kitasatospora sp. MAP12-44]
MSGQAVSGQAVSGRPFAGAGSVRARVTAVAGLALTLAVALGLVLLYLLQVGSAHRTADDQLRTYAAQIEQAGQDGSWPRPLPAFALDANAQAQVLAPDGTVLAATRALEGMGAVYSLPTDSDTPVRQKAGAAFPGELRAVGTRATVDGRPVSVVTLTSTDLLSQVDETFARLLLIGLPAILLLACGTVWLVVGRALRPVERIRRSVTEITAADLSRRVPEPANHDEVGQLARTMNDMLARLDDSATRQRRFVADASHELRSPLAAIRTTLEVGLAHPATAPWPQIAQRAARQSSRLETLVQELVVLAKSDDRQLVAHRSAVDLGELAEEIRATSPSPLVAVQTAQHAPGEAVVLGDREHLGRMVRNLVDNAVRFARHRVLITVLDLPPGEVGIEVSDDGPGIPAEERERVFGRFVRLDTSRERGSGSSGLGLAIAKEIATAHGGRISIAQAPGGGALLRITLPRAAG